MTLFIYSRRTGFLTFSNEASFNTHIFVCCSRYWFLSIDSPSHVQSLSAVPLLFSSCCCVAVFAVSSTACFLVFSFFLSSLSISPFYLCSFNRLHHANPSVIVHSPYPLSIRLVSNCAVSCFVIFPQFLCQFDTQKCPSFCFSALSRNFELSHFTSFFPLGTKSKGCFCVSIHENPHFYFFVDWWIFCTGAR